MTMILLPINYFIPETSNTILLVLKIFAFGIVGAVIYLYIMYKNKGLYDAFGKDQIDSIIKKLHLKKSR